MSLVAAIAGSAPWVLVPALAVWRATRSRSIGSTPLRTPAPLVSIVIPARNEARNIERCLRSVLSTTYPAVEVIVVDDHSEDATASLARALAARDARLSVIESPPLPAGWFGKQWACATGAAAARGELLLFADADTWHAPRLIEHAVAEMQSRGLDLLSLVGRQEMRSFWERLVQPQVFWLLLARYGGTEGVGRARRAEDVIANGQFMLVRLDAYRDVGGHESVRDKVAEDLALAQRFFRSSRPIGLALARDELSTHMYASLDEVVRGWRKNVFAGGIDAMPGGVVGRALLPLLLVLAPLMTVAPPLVLVAALAGWLGHGWLVWSLVCLGANLLSWTIVYREFDLPWWYTVLSPAGAAVFLYIILSAVARGRRVEWKGREYLAR